MVEHLVKHAKEQCYDFDLRVMGYRRTQINSAVAEYDVLIFVENTQSFAFLLDVENWPAQLIGKEYSRKMPSIPPQLSDVIQNVAFNVDWDEFVQDIKRQYQGSAWDGTVPSHPIPSHPMGRFFRKSCPMGWDGTEGFENRPIPWDDIFFIPSHPIPWEKIFL